MELVDNRFEIRARIGAGGMGAVYQAFDHTNGALVALKILHEGGEARNKQFLREGRIIAELHHPGVVRHIAHGKTAKGMPYLAMEWLEGETLGERLRRAPLRPQEALGLVAGVADALSAVHRRGIVHRDLKPDNIFLRGKQTGDALLLDFGVACLASEASHLAQPDVLVGTPSYMAPEQIRATAVDQRIDIFALGCVLFECLKGEPLWTGKGAVAIMAKILFEDPPLLSQVLPSLPDEVLGLLGRMLEKDRKRRVSDAGALASALGVWSSTDRLHAPPSARRPIASLTTAENQLVCVVLAQGNGEQKALSDLAETYSARLEVLMDGTLVAVMSGASEATDLVFRAARYAFALREQLGESRIALSTGRAVVTDVLPMGEAIDGAAALLGQSAGQSGAIRVDEMSMRLLSHRFEVLTDAFSAYLLRATPHSDEARLLFGKKTPCVGRDAELLLMEKSFLRTITQKEAAAFLLKGPAGSGKSRLWHELAPRFGRAFAETWFMRGDPIRQGSGFSLLSQALRQAAGIREGDVPVTMLAKLKKRVAFEMPPSEAPRVMEFLGEICGVHFPDELSLQLKAARQDAMLMADQMRRAFEDFVLETTRKNPLLLVLEDLQWGDLPTVQFIDAVLRNAGDRPLFVFAMGRPEVDEVFPDLWAGRRMERVSLGELSEEDCKAFVYAVLGRETSQEKAARIATLAGGNPFALEELIRAALSGEIGDLPSSVLSMAQARLQVLPEDQRLVLRAASIFGDSFRAPALRALLGQKASLVDIVLPKLEEREILVGETDYRVDVPDQKHYNFRHSLLREAAYAMVTDEDRTLGHALAAEWLSKAGEQDAVLLAQHYDRGGDKPRAAQEYARAAEQALAASDLESVFRQTGRARECGVRGEKLALLRLLDATAYHWRAEYEQCERAALDALQSAKPVSVPWYRAASELAEALLPLGKIAPLLALGKALHAPPGKNAAAARAFVMASATISMQLLLSGQHEIGQRVMVCMEEAEARIVDPGPLVRARGAFARATRAMIAGDLGQTLDMGNRTVENYEEAGDRRNAILMQCNLAHINMELGEYQAAERILRAASTDATRIGLPSVAVAAQQNLGFALALGGHIEEGKGVEAQCVVLSTAAADKRMIGRSRIYLSQMHIMSGDIGLAIEEASAALRELQSVPNVRAFGLATLGSALLLAGRPEEAQAAAAEAMTLLESLGSLDQGDTLVRLVYARVKLANGDAEEARRVMRIARSDLLTRASKIADPIRAKSFLERVADNAATLVLAEELGG